MKVKTPKTIFRLAPQIYFMMNYYYLCMIQGHHHISSSTLEREGEELGVGNGASTVLPILYGLQDLSIVFHWSMYIVH